MVAPHPAFDERTLERIVIDDEASFRHVGIYGELKAILRRDGYRFRVLPEAWRGRWDRAVFLNLTFWGAAEGGDVLTGDRIAADVVAHAAWHHLAAKALSREGAPLSADALFLGEAIASAFDVYLVGRLLGHAPDSEFLATQVPAMADSAGEAGLPEADFEALLEGIAADPERAFEDLRQLLFGTATRLVRSLAIDEGAAVLADADAHRFGALLHHYELSNWILYARAHGGDEPDPRAQSVDRALREAPVALDWLAQNWVDRL